VWVYWKMIHELMMQLKTQEAQVDFAQDKRWNAWNDKALRRFLNTQPENRTVGKTALCKHDVMLPGEPTRGIPKSWSCAHEEDSALVTPTIVNRNHEVYDTEPINGVVKQAMALEDDLWDLDLVSWIIMPLTLSCIIKP
jgi:hypothetical protein